MGDDGLGGFGDLQPLHPTRLSCVAAVPEEEPSGTPRSEPALSVGAAESGPSLAVGSRV